MAEPQKSSVTFFFHINKLLFINHYQTILHSSLGTGKIYSKVKIYLEVF